jgi:hypothetical protein
MKKCRTAAPNKDSCHSCFLDGAVAGIHASLVLRTLYFVGWEFIFRWVHCLHSSHRFSCHIKDNTLDTLQFLYPIPQLLFLPRLPAMVSLPLATTLCCFSGQSHPPQFLHSNHPLPPLGLSYLASPLWNHVISIYQHSHELLIDSKLFCHQHQTSQQFCREPGVKKVVHCDVSMR